MTKKHKLGIFSMAILTGAALLAPHAIEAKESPTRPPARVALDGKPKTPEKKSLVEPKPLTQTVENGLAWLAKNQLPDGSWGQGEESASMGTNENMAYKGSVADSCIAILALYRAGSTPTQGPYKDNVSRGVDSVIDQVMASDPESLYVTEVRGTRVQSKIGTYVDTFLANLMLAELKGHMGSDAGNKRLDEALNKVITKIENHQGEGGSWDNQGWAPVLSQSIAAKGLNRSRQVGAEVKDETLDRAQKYAEAQYDPATGAVASDTAAGVNLYAVSAANASMQERANTNAQEERKYRDQAKNGPTADDRKAAQQKLDLIAKEKEVNEAVGRSTVAQTKDPAFVSGFGSNGGEEFLSYMNISEALVVKGGKDWEEWDKSMADNLSRIQNPDGSWSGHHCITGKTFCTASALLVLTADRMSLPVASR